MFSADSAHLAYTARRGDKIAFVLDGVVAPEHDTLASLALGPRGAGAPTWPSASTTREMATKYGPGAR